MKIIDLLVYIGIAQSKSEARRLLKQKAVHINGVLIESNVFIFRKDGALYMLEI